MKWRLLTARPSDADVIHARPNAVLIRCGAGATTILKSDIRTHRRGE
jgi:hypothetical protein